MQPITLVGSGFKPREQVRVTVVREDQTAVRPVAANREGAFVVGFVQLTLRRCAALSVKASGARGSHAVLKLAAPACSSH
jgi:hypothetical protein